MSKDNETISHDEVRNILDIHGGLPENWPAHMRQKILDCIASDNLQQAQQDALTLEKLLVEHKNFDKTKTGNNQALSERIIAELPEQNSTARTGSGSNKLYDWLLNWILQPVPVAVIAVAVLSISIINIQDADLATNPQTSETEIFEEWAWLDITDQTMSEQGEQMEYDLMELLELEVNDV